MNKNGLLLCTATLFLAAFSFAGCVTDKATEEKITETTVMGTSDDATVTTEESITQVEAVITTTKTLNENETSSSDMSDELTTVTPETEKSTTVQSVEKETSAKPTQMSTKAPAETTTGRYFVENTQETTTTVEDYKYGVKKTATVYNYYEVYSDGFRKLSYTRTVNSFDYSGYSASDEMLFGESSEKAAAYMAFYNEVLALVNDIRADAGVGPLTLDETLCRAATMRAVEMNYSDFFEHTRPDGRRCFSVFEIYSIEYMACGENIAAGYTTPSEVVAGWKESPGHYQNMINEKFTKLGVGMSCEEPGRYSHYWVQLFTN